MSWHLPGATPDRQSITSDWRRTDGSTIAGVEIRESRWVVKGNGALVELFRRDWFDEDHDVAQVFSVLLDVGGVSAWHAHGQTTDRLFVAGGSVRLVLYDPRPDRSTGEPMELLLSVRRPQLVIVPPGVWHGVQNIGSEPAIIVNMPNRAYEYEAPDHWRLPPDTAEIPFAFPGSAQ